MSEKPDFVPVKAHEVTDLALLPRRFDAFAAEVRTSFEMLGEKLLPAITRFDEALRDIGIRLSRLERDSHDLTARIDKLERAARRRSPKLKK